ncbi:hypothetical protein [Cognatishimia sp. F0-27]|uniref:hypothetical protein n=1 Tax=Cognatishimia sp. F0-27 TaxID=2816855 RepID=UPI001D0C5FF6|nr:hypothetical protein [Cognatishimia sp. F0-27]MCC1494529.1 hypothetical protein [Cognatishimia sp. F0-27]
MKNPKARLALSVMAAAALAGCVEDTGSTSPAMSVNAVEEQARVSCLAAVTRTTGNNETDIISSDVSEAGTRVVVGVGSIRAPWECIAYKDGSTTQPIRLTGMDFL